MKLLHCNICCSIFNLDFVDKSCSCGETSGRYLADGMNAVYSGDCSPIAIVNDEFYKSLKMVSIENKYQQEPTTCRGIEFKSFALLDCSTSIRRDE